MEIPDKNWTDFDLPSPPDPDNFEDEEEARRQMWTWIINVEYLNWKYTNKFRRWALGLGIAFCCLTFLASFVSLLSGLRKLLS